MRLRLILTLAWAAALLGSARAQDAPTELDYVPPGAFALAHVRVADLVNDPSTARSKALLLKRMPKELLAFNTQFQPSPMTFERVTAFALAGPKRDGGAGPRGPGPVGVIVRTTVPFDAKLVAAGFGAGAKPQQLHGRAVLVDDQEFALCVVDDRTLILGGVGAVGAALAPRAAGARPELAEALAEATKGHALTVGVRDDLAELFGSATPRGLPPAAIQFDGATSLLATYDLGARPAWFSSVRYADEAKAGAALAAWDAQAAAFRRKTRCLSIRARLYRRVGRGPSSADRSIPMAGNTVTFHRVLKAPAERVYRAFLDADAMAKWLPPHGFTGKVHSMDPKVGGGYKMSFTNFSSGQVHSFGGTYLELVPNQKLRYSDAFDDPNLPGEMTTTIVLSTVSCGTAVNIEQSGIPEMIPVEMCYLGWQQSLLLLTQLVEPDIPG